MPESSPTDLQAIGRRLIELREALGMTQAQFARLIQTTPQALMNWERGMNRPSIDAAYKIKEATGGVQTDWIYSGDTRGMPTVLMQKLQERRARQEAAG